METVQSLIKNYKDNVLNSFPSVYSKGDVTHLLDLLSEEIERLPQEKPLLEIDYEEFKEDVIDKVEKVVDDYDFEECVELELNGREIEVTFNDRYNSVKDVLRDELNEFFDKSEFHKMFRQTEEVED
jgi:hypothetical protein